MPMPTPIDVLDAKRLAPVALPSDFWEAIDPALTLRAWFTAMCDNVTQLQSMRNQARDILAGRTSKAEARNILRDMLAATGYTPAVDHPMQDLRRPGRQNVMLETNMRMVAGYARREAYRHSVAYPAQRLVRLGVRKRPRNWEARWRRAYAEVGGEGAHPTQMVALTLSPIWRALSRFKQAYPPYDYNSGMGQEAVSYDEAEALGLIDQDAIDDIRGSEPEPLNEGVESHLSGLDPDLKDQITQLAGSRVRWQGDTLQLV